MKDEQPRIARLIEISRDVYDACLLPNGCLVAGPAHLPSYPRHAKSYLYCWPGRDLGFAVAAMESLGRPVRDPLLNWIWERAEDFQRSGLLYEEYHPNGPRRGPEWQPDQAGTLLWALCQAPRPEHERERLVVERLAGGLAASWNGTHFHARYRDLWEERFASPLHDSHFTHSLAACATGLRRAGGIYRRPEWLETADQMVSRLATAYDPARGHFPRRFGPVATDRDPDASLIGLVWPFDVGLDRDALRSAVQVVEDQLLSDRGVYRYWGDDYDSEVELGGAELRQGAGAWPLLTFWLAIVQHRLGDASRARRTFDIGLAAADADGYFPEQVFPPDDARVGVKPLLWSHMMFLLAAIELGLWDGIPQRAET